MLNVWRTSVLSVLGMCLAACGGGSNRGDAGHLEPVACGLAHDAEPNDTDGAPAITTIKLLGTQPTAGTTLGCLSSATDVDRFALDAPGPRVDQLALDRTAFTEGDGVIRATLGHLSIEADAGVRSGQLWMLATPGTAAPVVISGNESAVGGYEIWARSSPVAVSPSASSSEAAPVWTGETSLKLHALTHAEVPDGGCDVDAGSSWVKVTLSPGSHTLSKLAQPAGLRFNLNIRSGTAVLARLTQGAPAERTFSTDGGDVELSFTATNATACGFGELPAALTDPVEVWLR